MTADAELIPREKLRSSSSLSSYSAAFKSHYKITPAKAQELLGKDPPKGLVGALNLRVGIEELNYWKEGRRQLARGEAEVVRPDYSAV